MIFSYRQVQEMAEARELPSAEALRAAAGEYGVEGIGVLVHQGWDTQSESIESRYGIGDALRGLVGVAYIYSDPVGMNNAAVEVELDDERYLSIIAPVMAGGPRKTSIYTVFRLGRASAEETAEKFFGGKEYHFEPLKSPGIAIHGGQMFRDNSLLEAYGKLMPALSGLYETGAKSLRFSSYELLKD